MKEKNQIVKLSKFFKIVSNIMIGIMTFVTGVMFVVAIFFAIAMKSVEVKNGELYAADTRVLKVETQGNELTLTIEGEENYNFTLDENALKTVNYLIENATTNSITLVMELIFISAIAESCLIIAICIKAKNIFKDIIKEETPFVANTQENLKVIAILVGVILAIDIVLPILLSIITKLSVNLNIPLAGIISIVFILYLGYVSNHGYKLENPKKDK